MNYCSLHFLHLLHDIYKNAFVCIYSRMSLEVVDGVDERVISFF
jgi:hypothetical protein